MPKKDGLRLVRDFLLPSLDLQSFGRELEWVDEDRGIFGMNWLHKSNGRWKRSKDGAVYEAWARCKNLWESNDPKAISKAKQRLRAALRKLPNVKSLGCNNNYRRYEILDISELRQQATIKFPSLSPVYDSGYESASSKLDIEQNYSPEDFLHPDKYLPDWAKEEKLNYTPNFETKDHCMIEFESPPGYW